MKQRLHRPCSKCGERFLPTGKSCKLCEKCLREIQLNAAKWRNKEYYSKQKVKGGIK